MKFTSISMRGNSQLFITYNLDVLKENTYLNTELSQDEYKLNEAYPTCSFNLIFLVCKIDSLTILGFMERNEA